MSSISPSTPFHLARAYGAGAPAQARPAAVVQPLRQADRADVTARVGPAASKTASLVAGVVPGKAEFGPAQPAAARPASAGVPAALPFYRAPSDRNEAATAIMIGRSLDVNG